MLGEVRLREMQRIEFLVQRDGPVAACGWVKRTLNIYIDAIYNQRHYASTTHYRSQFEQSIKDFESWLKNEQDVRL